MWQQNLRLSYNHSAQSSWVDVATEVSETAVFSATEGRKKESGWVSRVRRSLSRVRRSLPIHLSLLKTLGKQGAHTHRVSRGVRGGETTCRCGWSGGLFDEWRRVIGVGGGLVGMGEGVASLETGINTRKWDSEFREGATCKRVAI